MEKRDMRCPGFREIIWDYLEGELEDPVRDRSDRHLADCPDCRRELKKAERLLKLLPAGRPPQPSPEYRAAFWPRLREQLAPRRPAILHPLYYGALAAAVATLILWVSLGGVDRPVREGPQSPLYALATASSPAEYGERSIRYISGPRQREPQISLSEIDYILPRNEAEETQFLEV